MYVGPRVLLPFDLDPQAAADWDLRRPKDPEKRLLGKARVSTLSAQRVKQLSDMEAGSMRGRFNGLALNPGNQRGVGAQGVWSGGSCRCRARRLVEAFAVPPRRPAGPAREVSEAGGGASVQADATQSTTSPVIVPTRTGQTRRSNAMATKMPMMALPRLSPFSDRRRVLGVVGGLRTTGRVA
ncbi:hypothetical protein [Kitasatospora purpeofusca]|uniref:hypothetical protein n=1 Tax=Kitasatospora purpeofusca TaxID=67352 RepID=UPI0035E14051